MDRDEQMRRAFSKLRFPGEPPMRSTSADDLRRAERHRRHRRVAVRSSGFAAIAVVATGVALALPTQPGSDSAVEPAGDRGGTVASGSVQSSEPVDRVPFPKTRQLLYDAAIEHLDRGREHLPDASTGATYGGSRQGDIDVGTKLSWNVPGESGTGLVEVHVTTPGYASFEPYALEGFASMLGCAIGSATCTQQTIPGTDQKAWVADANPQRQLQFGVVYERADGSLVGVGVHDLFGNISRDPVSSVDVTLDDAFAFVTDPDLRVDPGEAAEGVDFGKNSCPDPMSGCPDSDWR